MHLRIFQKYLKNLRVEVRLAHQSGGWASLSWIEKGNLSENKDKDVTNHFSMCKWYWLNSQWWYFHVAGVNCSENNHSCASSIHEAIIPGDWPKTRYYSSLYFLKNNICGMSSYVCASSESGLCGCIKMLLEWVGMLRIWKQIWILV